MLLVVQISIVGNKHVVSRHLFHHRMPSSFDVNDPLFVEGRADILIALRHIGKRCKYIQSCDGSGCTLDPLHLSHDGIPDLTEQIIFQ